MFSVDCYRNSRGYTNTFEYMNVQIRKYSKIPEKLILNIKGKKIAAFYWRKPPQYVSCVRYRICAHWKAFLVPLYHPLDLVRAVKLSSPR